MSDSFFTYAWCVWLVYFIAVETAAVIRKAPNDTLSEHVWAWFSIKNKKSGWRWRRIALLGFMSWLTMHFLTGGWA